MKTSGRLLPANPPTSYEALARLYLPRKIHGSLAYRSAIEVVDWLARRTLNPDQEDYLDLVSDLIFEYESELRAYPNNGFCGMFG
jgi:hypothetical protein